MLKDLNYYSNQLKRLRVNCVGGKAPYQPLLLLSLIELVDQGLITQNQFPLSPELIAVFIKYRTRLSSEYYQADMAQPFYHMSVKEGSFWHLMPKPGYEEVLKSGARLNTLNKLRNNILYGYFDQELFDLLAEPLSRNILISVLLETWFPGKIYEIRELLKVSEFEQLQFRLKELGGAVYKVGQFDELELTVRDAAFRKTLISLYDHRCAFCRIRIISSNSQNVIDGAHIKPFSKFQDNRYTNGLTLCKNHHWAFDHGWFGISDNYKIVIPKNRFVEDAAIESRSTQDFDNESIYLPQQEAFYPSQESLSWHRDAWKIAS
jgi:putative restriction endonuclease